MISYSYYFFEEQIKFHFLNFYCLCSELVIQSLSRLVRYLVSQENNQDMLKMLVSAAKIKIFTRRGPYVVFSGYYFNYITVYFIPHLSANIVHFILWYIQSLLFTSQSYTLSTSCRISTYCPVEHLFFFNKTTGSNISNYSLFTLSEPSKLYSVH